MDLGSFALAVATTIAFHEALHIALAALFGSRVRAFFVSLKPLPMMGFDVSPDYLVSKAKTIAVHLGPLIATPLLLLVPVYGAAMALINAASSVGDVYVCWKLVRAKDPFRVEEEMTRHVLEKAWIVKRFRADRG